MPNARSWRVFCLLFAMLAIGGCTQPLNDRLTLGGTQLSPTLSLDRPVPESRSSGLFESRALADRTQWSTTQFVASYDGVVHGQSFRVEPPLRQDSSARFYGRHPTVEDVLDPQTRSWGQRLHFAIDDVGRSIVGTPFLLAYWGWHGELFGPSLSPRPYKRSRQNDWSSGAPATSTEIGDMVHD